MLDKLKSMFEAQKKMKDVQNNLERLNVDYEGAKGRIKLKMNGTQKLLSVDIDESFLTPEMKQSLEKELLLSINSLQEKVQRVAQQELKQVMGDFKIPGL